VDYDVEHYNSYTNHSWDKADYKARGLFYGHNDIGAVFRYTYFLCKPVHIMASLGTFSPISDWLVYSCCSHLKHRAFFSLQFLNLRQSV
jgi:hypothetical protein